MSALLLYILAITDWGFAGYRHAAGRDGRIFKRTYYLRAIGVGLVFGHVAVALVGALVAGLLVVTSYSTMLLAATPMVIVFGVYAAIVLLAFIPYLFGQTEIRTLATVSVFGPLTLLRPVVIVTGAALAIVYVPQWPVALAALVAATSNLAAEPLLGRLYPLPRA